MASSNRSLRYNTIDVFTDKRFSGNQLAIVHVPKSVTIPQEEKQAIAKEFNYPETIFLHEDPTGKRTWTIDIFTVGQELDFAGHPTIGAGCYLGSVFPDLGEGTLITKAGPIPFKLQRNSSNGLLTSTEAIPHNVRQHEYRVSRQQLDLLQPGLGEKVKVAESFPVVSCTNGMHFVLIEMASLQDLGQVKGASTVSAKSFVTLDKGWNPAEIDLYFFALESQSPKDGKMRAQTRMVAPTFEDPATGSAASALSAYLALEQAKSGQLQGGSLQVDILQGVEMGRPSNITVRVNLNADHSIKDIFLIGSVVPVMAGKLQ